MYFKECLLNFPNVSKKFLKFCCLLEIIHLTLYSHSGFRLNTALTRFKSMVLVSVFEEPK